ncbi:hypothetical protein EDB99_107111 [Pseudomonas sp. 460]|nr:hypothetical protein EDB99_107111 [Pseudomonas sp. 460]
MATQQTQFELPEGFCSVTAHTTALPANEAYVAVGSNGVVDGGCFTESEETLPWFNRAVAAGAQVLRGPRSDANKLLARTLASSVASQLRSDR